MPVSGQSHPAQPRRLEDDMLDAVDVPLVPLATPLEPPVEPFRSAIPPPSAPPPLYFPAPRPSLGFDFDIADFPPAAPGYLRRESPVPPADPAPAHAGTAFPGPPPPDSRGAVWGPLPQGGVVRPDVGTESAAPEAVGDGGGDDGGVVERLFAPSGAVPAAPSHGADVATLLEDVDGSPAAAPTGGPAGVPSPQVEGAGPVAVPAASEMTPRPRPLTGVHRPRLPLDSPDGIGGGVSGVVASLDDTPAPAALGSSSLRSPSWRVRGGPQAFSPRRPDEVPGTGVGAGAVVSPRRRQQRLLPAASARGPASDVSDGECGPPPAPPAAFGVASAWQSVGEGATVWTAPPTEAQGGGELPGRPSAPPLAAVGADGGGGAVEDLDPPIEPQAPPPPLLARDVGSRNITAAAAFPPLSPRMVAPPSGRRAIAALRPVTQPPPPPAAAVGGAPIGPRRPSGDLPPRPGSGLAPPGSVVGPEDEAAAAAAAPPLTLRVDDELDAPAVKMAVPPPPPLRAEPGRATPRPGSRGSAVAGVDGPRASAEQQRDRGESVASEPQEDGGADGGWTSAARGRQAWGVPAVVEDDASEAAAAPIHAAPLSIVLPPSSLPLLAGADSEDVVPGTPCSPSVAAGAAGPPSRHLSSLLDELASPELLSPRIRDIGRGAPSQLAGFSPAFSVPAADSSGSPPDPSPAEPARRRLGAPRHVPAASPRGPSPATPRAALPAARAPPPPLDAAIPPLALPTAVAPHPALQAHDSSGVSGRSQRHLNTFISAARDTLGQSSRSLLSPQSLAGGEGSASASAAGRGSPTKGARGDPAAPDEPSSPTKSSSLARSLPPLPPRPVGPEAAAAAAGPGSQRGGGGGWISEDPTSRPRTLSETSARGGSTAATAADAPPAASPLSPPPWPSPVRGADWSSPLSPSRRPPPQLGPLGIASPLSPTRLLAAGAVVPPVVRGGPEDGGGVGPGTVAEWTAPLPGPPEGGAAAVHHHIHHHYHHHLHRVDGGSE